MIRAKMTCQSATPGEKGFTYSLSAVYETDQSLRGLSENAIYGDSTPNGYLELVTALAVPGLIHDHWAQPGRGVFYVDLYGPDEEANKAGSVYATGLDLRYCNRNSGESVAFRYISPSGDHVSLFMTVHNPTAIAWMRGCPVVEMVIRRAVGRKSETEIAARRRLLEEEKAKAKDDFALRYPDSYAAGVKRRELELLVAEGADPLDFPMPDTP